MVMPGGMGTLSLPLGPVTSNCGPTWIFTPLGSGIGFFPIRDINLNLLPHPAKNLAAHVFLVGVPAGHHTARGRQNVNAHTAQHARDVGLTDIYPAARPGNAF